MSNNVQQAFATTAFGDLSTESLHPVTQITASNGLLSGVLTVTDNAASGSTSVVDNMYTCQTGVSATGLGSILTSRNLIYRSGQGAAARFTALFDTPAANSYQSAGMITSENSFSFGYIDQVFGVVHAYDGINEIQDLVLTTPAAGAEVATVTIDGTPYNVNLTGIGTVNGDAFEIATSLQAQLPNYRITSNNDTVKAISLIPTPQGAFAYTSATSVGAWTQLASGMEPTIDFVPQTSWNEDTRPDLDPQMGNVYQVQFQYLGFGDIKFFVEDSDTGEFVLVHTIRYANKNTSPSVSNPIFRVGWLARNLGNTTNLTVRGGSAGAFIQGNINRENPPRAEFNDQTAVPTTLTNIVSLRNRIDFAGKINRLEVFPQLITGSSQTNKSTFFFILLNPDFASPLDWQYVDQDNSIVESAKDFVGVSGGQIIGGITVGASGDSVQVDFNRTNNSESVVTPGNVLCICAQTTQGTADTQVSVTWQEDL